MIKKTLMLLFVLISATAIAQNANQEKRAKVTVEKMKKIVNLTEEQADKVYRTKLYFVKRAADVRSDYPLASEQRKVEIKNVNKAYSKSLQEIIGKENKNKWFAYMKENRKK